VASPLELYTEVLYHAASSRVQDTTRRVAANTVLCLSHYRRASVFFPQPKLIEMWIARIETCLALPSTQTILITR
jgi:hypothetical protein